MTFVILLFFVLILCSVRFIMFNDNYIAHETTTQINGVFVFLVFLSHFRAYFDSEISYSVFYYGLQNNLGQLVVTTFLFYSGYGVYTSIKKKGKDYIDQLPLKILELLASFVLVITLFLILGWITGKNYDFSRILLSFIGWESVGNSNWYMFDILLLYALTYIAFKITKKDKHAIGVLFILSLCAMLFLYTFQNGTRWYNTFLCYWLGILFAYYKPKFDQVMFNHKSIYMISTLLLLIFVYILGAYQKNVFFFMLRAIAFVLLVNQISMVVILKNPVLKWLGKHIFGIYLLQRIPMILGEYYGLAEGGFLSTTFYFITTLILTMLLAVIFHKVTNWMSLKIFKPLKLKVCE